MRANTSASNLFRRFLCPGSAKLEAGLPEEDSEQSREGQLLHDYSAHPEYERKMLKPAQQDLLKIADDLTKTVIETVEQSNELDCDYTDWIEHAFRMVGVEFSGTPDFARFYRRDFGQGDFANSSILIIDRKFGYGFVERAELNLQLRSYAVLAHTGIEKAVCVAIAQPRAPYDERITIASYTSDDIADSREQIVSILEATKDPDAPLVAGEAQCRYCKAKMICTAFREQMMLPAVITPDTNLSKTAREAYLEKKLAECSNEELSKVMNAVKLAGLIKEPANDEARKRISAGTMPGYSLGKETGVRSIADVKRAVGLLSIGGLSTDDIYDCITGMAIGRIEEKLRETKKATTAKDAKKWVNTRLSKVIETENRKPKIIKG